MFLYLYPFYMCLFFRSLILCVCLRDVTCVSVFADVMENKVQQISHTSCWKFSKLSNTATSLI